MASRTLIAALGVLTTLLPGPAGAAASFPPGFAESLVLNGLYRPTALDFGPNGELWISGQQGQVWIYRGGTPIVAAQIHMNIEGERGISGIALDPDYATNHFVWPERPPPGPYFP